MVSIVPSYDDLKKEFRTVFWGFQEGRSSDWQLHDSCKDVAPADPDSCDIISFDEHLSTEEVMCRILSRGFRLPTLHEFFAWAQKSPSGRLGDAVACLGVSCIYEGLHRVPGFYWEVNGRHLQLPWTKDGWSAGRQFLVVRV